MPYSKQEDDMLEKELLDIEKEHNIFKPKVDEAILYLMFTEKDLDISRMKPEYFIFEDFRNIYNDIVKWRAEGKEPDFLAFEHKTGHNLIPIKERCTEYFVHRSMLDSYVDRIQFLHEEERVFEIMESCKDIPAKEALKIMTDYVEKMKSRETPDLPVAQPNPFIHDYLEELDERKKNPEPHVKTGFDYLDKCIWGIGKGEVFVVGARTGIGKSAFCINVSASNIKKGKKVLFFSTEMSSSEQYSRLLSVVSKVDALKFRKASFNDEEWVRISEKTQWLYEGNNFVVCDMANPNIKQINAVVSAVKPDVVILDYIQRFAFERGDTRDRAIGDFMSQVKSMARNYECAVICASQLNRAVENRTSKRPTLADLRDSGNIEQEADQIFLIWIDGMSEEEIHTSDTINLAGSLEKNRHGWLGQIKMKFIKRVQTIVESED